MSDDQGRGRSPTLRGMGDNPQAPPRAIEVVPMINPPPSAISPPADGTVTASRLPVASQPSSRRITMKEAVQQWRNPRAVLRRLSQPFPASRLPTTKLPSRFTLWFLSTWMGKLYLALRDLGPRHGE